MLQKQINTKIHLHRNKIKNTIEQIWITFVNCWSPCCQRSVMDLSIPPMAAFWEDVLHTAWHMVSLLRALINTGDVRGNRACLERRLTAPCMLNERGN